MLKLFDGGPMGGGGMMFFQDAWHVLRVIPWAMLAAIIESLAYAAYVEYIEPRLKREK